MAVTAVRSTAVILDILMLAVLSLLLPPVYAGFRVWSWLNGIVLRNLSSLVIISLRKRYIALQAPR